MESLPQALRAHGSKLNAIAECLRRIKRDDDEAQVIVFVQWEELAVQVANALGSHELPFVKPQLNVLKSDWIDQFQAGRGPWVLILSLERAASGLQLTAANHVFFVHPMNAASRKVAVSYEQQAIGRIRRIGQTRESVHVWRFVTRDTVEEHISKLHCAYDCLAPIVAAPQVSAQQSGLAVNDLEVALAESLRDADAQAADINAPIVAALHHSLRLPVFHIIEVSRTTENLDPALLAGPELQGAARPRKLRSGVKVFAPTEPPQLMPQVLRAVGDHDPELRPRHIVVADCFLNAVLDIIKKLPGKDNTYEKEHKRRRLAYKQPRCDWIVRRTFLHIPLPSSFSEPSTKPKTA